MVQLQLNQICISPGQRVQLEGINWSEFEPDDCFYIQACLQIVGKTWLDLAIDPPPDLAIEVDSSKTQFSAYEALKVPEIWCYDKGSLKFFVLQNGRYIEAQFSPNFPTLPLLKCLPQFIQRGQTEVMSAVQRSFRQWAQEQIARC